jgi:putative sugar O-methyltransferase
MQYTKLGAFGNWCKEFRTPRVVEIGGGLGRTAFYSSQLGVKDYTIIDLPFTAVSQAYFLMRTLGMENVILHGESGAPQSKIKLLQPSAFLEGTDKVDLIVNIDSMTEFDRPTADRYWGQIKRRSTQFLSINHEANPFTVKEIAEADEAGVASSQRYPYALRNGYVEELFTFG